MKTMALALCVVLAGILPAWAGENPSAKLAMHVVASNQYLDCADLMPAACESINVDISVGEVLAASGYGYIAFVAYDVLTITGAEFAVDGWPTGRGAPPLSGPYWCPEGTLTMGDPLGSGGIAAFPCAEASADGLLLIGYCSFGPLSEANLPITLQYASSDFSYPNDPHNYVLDCTIDYEEDSVVASTGCTIGASHWESPDCPGEAGGGEESDQFVAFDTLLVIDNPEAQEALVALNGRRIEYPFTLTVAWQDEQRLRGKLHINGVLARLAPKPKPIPHYPAGDLAKLHMLGQSVHQKDDALRNEGVSQADRVEAIASFLTSVAWLDSVKTTSTSVKIFPREEERLPPFEFDIRPRTSEPFHGPPDRLEYFLSQARSLRRFIRKGGFVAMGDDYPPMYGGERTRIGIERKVAQMLDAGETNPQILLADFPSLTYPELAADLIRAVQEHAGQEEGEQ
jgi:hypothetical protein